MGIFFGTDGIRGIVNDELTFGLAYNCGNALGNSKSRPTIVIGRDTRVTGSYLTLGFAGGAMSAGAKVIDIGVCPTAGIAYITKALKADYGVVVSASHNPADYNGIKIFDGDGCKLGDAREDALEKKFVHQVVVKHPNIGLYEQDYKLTNLYYDYLKNCSEVSFDGLTVVIDGSNGAAHKIAPGVFRDLGAKVIATNCRNEGLKINLNCGSLYPEILAKAVLKYNADIGVAFDGDSDRIIVVDEKGNILDGDLIIFMLAKYLKCKGELDYNCVVGTRHTNMGLEKALQEEGIELLRTDIGDKYVIAKLNERKLALGGEQSGHIIFRKLATTGDGILTGIKIVEMVKVLNKKLSELAHVDLYPQSNINCRVKDKMHVINSELLTNAINEEEQLLGKDARIMVRVSGTEAKVRIMVECQSLEKAEKSARRLESIIKKIDEEFN